jgi:uncharacterized protein
MQARNGAAIDMVDPLAEDIDFAVVCRSLADINRFSGAAQPAVSVAFHTLIVAELVDDSLKPYALLHDAHEAFVGDLTTPTVLALAAIAGENHKHGFGIVQDTVKELKLRHDLAIWEAAGLPPPTADQIDAIKFADHRALATEFRDFMVDMPCGWGNYFAGVKPAAAVYAAGWFGATPAMVGSRLLSEMKRCLPVYQCERAVA